MSDEYIRGVRNAKIGFEKLAQADDLQCPQEFEEAYYAVLDALISNANPTGLLGILSLRLREGHGELHVTVDHPTGVWSAQFVTKQVAIICNGVTPADAVEKAIALIPVE